MTREHFYNTKQKEIIINIIKNQTHEFTIKDIYNAANKKVGLTTIYRLIQKLENENKLNKHIGKENVTYYQYLEKCENQNHFYLKCEKCGKLIHIDCGCIEELSNHIYKKHKFRLNSKHIIINGICDECINKGE